VNLWRKKSKQSFEELNLKRLKSDFIATYKNIGIAFVNLRNYYEAIQTFKVALILGSNNNLERKVETV